MEQLQVILSVAGTALGLLVSTITFIAKYIKSAKGKKAAEQTIAICNSVIPFIEKAETFLNYSGEEKKEYVLTKANQYALSKGIPFDTEAVSTRIEELVALTKEVNKREKDKQAAVATA